ncbi:GIN domain-containing protein [Mucilaginibacter lutimaris]|uniref:GIN domain-containing protein n=1 Tax=Mucilaginibacter lutimaris TaxID=931629 RepID=A0ABW2ZDD1_9SPHI
MKTSILTIATIFTLAVGTVSSTFASVKNNNDEVSTVLTNVSKINKIELHGNVELFISDGAADEVKVYNKYYAESALVQSQNGTLRISSYTDKKLVVWVKAADLQTIVANDNSTVKSFGSLEKLDFAVTLNNNASAELNLDAYKTSINVNDRAKANISGTVNDYNLVQDQSATVNHTNLAAVNRNKTVTNKFVKAEVSELAIL